MASTTATKKPNRWHLFVGRVGQLVGFGSSCTGAAVLGMGIAGVFTAGAAIAPLYVGYGLVMTTLGLFGFKKSNDLVADIKGERPTAGRGPTSRTSRWRPFAKDPNKERYNEALRNADPDLTPDPDYMSPRKEQSFQDYDVAPSGGPQWAHAHGETTPDLSFGSSGDGGSGGDGGGSSLAATARLLGTKNNDDFGL